MANMPGQIQSLTGGLPVSHFVKSADYKSVKRNVDELKKRVVLVYGKSGHGKTQIGHQIMNEWSVDNGRRVFFFQTQTSDLYKASYSSILERNGWNQDSEWARDPDQPEDYDFLKLCRYISKQRSRNQEKILFHFDDVSDDKGRPTQQTKEWITKFYKIIHKFSIFAPVDMQLIVTVPMKPDEVELCVNDHVYIHTMTGFADSDIKLFFRISLSHEPPEFLLTRVAEISNKMGQSPQLYRVKLDRLQSMGSDERELDDFLEELDKYESNSLIKERLLRLTYLEIWKVMTNFERINIPSELFYAVLVYCRETDNLGLSPADRVGEIFAIMRSEYLRCNFITEVREGKTKQQIDWTIHTEVHNCLVELVRNDTEAERRTYLKIGLMAMASIVDRDDRFHSDKRQFPRRHINMLSQTNCLYNKVSPDLMTDLSPFRKLAVYQLLTGIYYAKLNKVGSDLHKRDLKDFYKSILELEELLSSTGDAGRTAGEQLRAPEDESPIPYRSDVGCVPETRSRYESMRAYLREESDDECDTALRLHRFSERDEKTFETCWKERDVRITKFRAKAHHFGMLTEEQLKKLREIRLVLGYHAYRQVYPLEVLASMYIILGKMREHVNGIDGETEFWSKTPYDIFRHVTYYIFEVIKDAARKDFMQKVIIERDQILQNRDNQMSLGEIRQKYENLKKIKEVYEYGFLRSNMEKDSYHHLNCIEGLLETIGNFMLYPGKTNQDVSSLAQEGMEVCKKIKLLVQMLHELSRDRHNSWRQYAYGMEYVAMFMMKCGQTLEGFRYYTYALYSFYEYTDKRKDKIVTEKKFIKMCKTIVKLENPPANFLTGLAAQTVREKMIVGCICLLKPGGGDASCDICSNNGLYVKFLHEFQGEETGIPEVGRAIDILIHKLTSPTEKTTPSEEHQH